MKLIDALNQMMNDADFYSDLLCIFPGTMSVGIQLADTGESARLILGERKGVGGKIQHQGKASD